MSVTPSVAVDNVYINNTGGKSSNDDTDWWPMFRHDLNHSGYSTSDAPDTNNVLWSHKIGASVSSSPAVVNGRVYIGSEPHFSWFDNVYCLDANTGDKIWSSKIGYHIEFSSPAVVDGKVYIGSNDYNVYCLDAISGAYIWSYTTGDWVLSSPAVVDGKVYIGSFDNYVYCLDANTGAIIWGYKTYNEVWSSPAVVDGKVYIGSSSGWSSDLLYCLDANSGDKIWDYYAWNVISSPAVADGRVYIGSGMDSGNVDCLDANTGDCIWPYCASEFASSPAVADGKVYIGSKNLMYCLDANYGVYIWSYKTGYMFFKASSPAVADGKVYIGSNDGNIYAFGELDSDAPSAPEINGPVKGVPDVLYNFTFKSESPVGNDLFYWIEWADGSNIGWLGPYGSGVNITESHMWDAEGEYPVQARAKDINGSVSSWGVIQLNIPRNRATTYSLFQLLLNRFPLLEVFLRAMNLLR